MQDHQPEQAYSSIFQALDNITKRTNLSGVQMPAGHEFDLWPPRPISVYEPSLATKAIDTFLDSAGMSAKLRCIDAVVKAACGYRQIVLGQPEFAGLIVARECYYTVLEIQAIVANESQKGFATDILTRLTEAADKHCVDIWLNAEPYSNIQSNIGSDKLIALFERFGFVRVSEIDDEWKTGYHEWAKCRFLAPMYRPSKNEPDLHDVFPWLPKRANTQNASKE